MKPSSTCKYFKTVKNNCKCKLKNKYLFKKNTQIFFYLQIIFLRHIKHIVIVTSYIKIFCMYISLISLNIHCVCFQCSSLVIRIWAYQTFFFFLKELLINSIKIVAKKRFLLRSLAQKIRNVNPPKTI